MPIDPNIALGAQPVQINPLQMMGQTAALQNNMLQAQALGQQVGANQAISDALRQAVRPDGSLDTAKARYLIGQSNAAHALPQFMSSLQDQEVKQQTLANSKLDYRIKKLEAIRGSLGGLMTDPDLNHDKVTNWATGLVSGGLADANDVANELSSMPKDPAQLRQWLTTHYTAGLKGEAQLKAIQPNLMQVNSGGQTQLINTNNIGAVPYGVIGTIQNTMTPGEAAQEVKYADPNTGAPRSMSRAQFAAMTNGAQPGVNPALPGTSAPGYPPSTTQNGPQQNLPGIQMGPSPYASAFKEGEAKNMVNYSNDLNSRVQNGYQVSDNINTILGLLNEFRAGGGASFRAKLGQMAQAGLVPQSAVDALVGGKLSAAQAFDALGGQQVLSNLKTLLDGQGKIGQQEFKLLSHAMVNMDNDPNATRIVLGVTQRSVQRAQAEQAAFTEWKNSGQDVTAFPNYWRSVLNPAPQAQQKAGPQRQAPQRQARPSLNSIFGN